MTLTPEHAENIKKQLLEQIEKSDLQGKEQIIESVKAMNEEQLEEFLKQNNIKYSETEEGSATVAQGDSTPIFQQIIEGKVPSYKLDQNDKAIAVLNINPLSEGHIMIIPKIKVPVEKLPKPSLALAQKMATRLRTKLKPDDIKIETFTFQDYPAINVIPIYKDKKLEQKEAKESDLKKLQKKLETKHREPRERKSKTNPKNPLKGLPKIKKFRIP